MTTARTRPAIAVGVGDEYSTVAARTLLEFAEPELRELGARPRAKRIQETLLWAAFAWNQSGEPPAARAEMMGALAGQLGREHADWVESMMHRRRSTFTGAEVEVGPLRVEKANGGGFILFVDRVD